MVNLRLTKSAALGWAKRFGFYMFVSFVVLYLAFSAEYTAIRAVYEAY